jgi:hypothetical protein
MLIAYMLSVIKLSVLKLSVVKLSVVKLSVFKLSVIMKSVVRLCVVKLSVVKLSVVKLSVIKPSVIKLSVIMHSVVGPTKNLFILEILDYPLSQHNQTLSLTAVSIMTVSLKGLYITLCIKKAQQNWILSITMLCIILSVVVLNVKFYLLLF